MESAEYFRSQAELCLELACQMSDRKDIERLRITAARYFARASELDSRAETTPRAPGIRQDVLRERHRGSLLLEESYQPSRGALSIRSGVDG